MVLGVLPCLSSPFAYADHSTNPALVSPAAAPSRPAWPQPCSSPNFKPVNRSCSKFILSYKNQNPLENQNPRNETACLRIWVKLGFHFNAKFLQNYENFLQFLNGTLPTGTREGKRAQTGTADLRASKDGAPRTKRCRLCRPTHG